MKTYLYVRIVQSNYKSKLNSTFMIRLKYMKLLSSGLFAKSNGQKYEKHVKPLF